MSTSVHGLSSAFINLIDLIDLISLIDLFGLIEHSEPNAIRNILIVSVSKADCPSSKYPDKLWLYSK